MMKATYSEGFREQALKKVFQRDQRSIREVAEEMQVNYHTLKGWMKETVAKDTARRPERAKRPDDWTLAERLTALQESHGLAGEALQAWCRERGVFAHQLVAWQEAFCAGAGEQRGQPAGLADRKSALSARVGAQGESPGGGGSAVGALKEFQALLGGEVE